MIRGSSRCQHQLLLLLPIDIFRLNRNNQNFTIPPIRIHNINIRLSASLWIFVSRICFSRHFKSDVLKTNFNSAPVSRKCPPTRNDSRCSRYSIDKVEYRNSEIVIGGSSLLGLRPRLVLAKRELE